MVLTTSKKSKNINSLDKLYEYVRDVQSGKILACNSIQQAVKRFVDDEELSKTDPDYPYYFDQDAASRVLRFFDYLKHYSGPSAGKRFILEPWQVFIVANIFGWKNCKNGLRRFRTAYIEVGRKAGKAIDINTPMLTVDGWKKMIDIHPGDFVFDEHGKPTKVIAESEIFDDEDCYELSFSHTDETIIAGENHEWGVIDNEIKGHKDQYRVIKTKEIFENPYRFNNKDEARYKIKLPGALDNGEQYTKITSIKSVPKIKLKCIQVENESHLYLCGKSLIPTHNSFLMSGIALYVLLKEHDAPQIFSAATKKDQARLIFQASRACALKSKPLRKRLDIQRHKLTNPITFGEFIPLSADADTLDGLSPSLTILDELHAHRSSAVYDVMVSAMGAREEPLLISITTAGFNLNGKCYEVRTYVKSILSKQVSDETFFGMIFEYDNDDDWKNPELFIKANPNLGVSISKDYLEQQLKQATTMPTAKTNFLTKHCNVWVNAEDNYIDMEKWLACGEDFDINTIDKDDIERGFLGLDLSTTTDLTAIGICLIMKNGDWLISGKSYLPKERVLTSQNLQYKSWANEGILTLTEGRTVDYQLVENDICELYKRFKIEEVLYDDWNSSSLVARLLERDIEMVKFGQGFKSMSPALKDLETRYLDGKIKHDNNPILNWCASNMVIISDPAGNIKPVKSKNPALKIDLLVAVIMATGRAAVKTGPVFDEDEFINNLTNPYI